MPCPKLVDEILRINEKSIEDISFVIFHQANKFMLDYLRKKMKNSRIQVLRKHVECWQYRIINNPNCPPGQYYEGIGPGG